MSVRPMPSARIHSGKYEVIGTTHECMVETHLWGWKLMVDGEFHKAFDTKREALVYCQEHPEL